VHSTLRDDPMSVPISDFTRKRDEDSVEEISPFWGIDKGTVLQEARCFNEPQLDSRKCQQVITKLLHLNIQGELFTKTEITEIFFSVTKLFQAKNSNLRRMVYLIIKEICPSSDEVIIVTSSLMKDMNSKVDLYRANAIRVLCCIADSAILGQIERYLKQAIVDRSDAVASAALVSATHLTNTDMDIVRRWSSEIQEALNSSSPQVQFHALGLLYEIRKSDKLAANKLVTQLVRTQLRSPLAQCLLIRYAAEVLKDSVEPASEILHGFLQSCLRHKSELVVFESVRAITAQKDLSADQLGAVLTVLQLLLSSPRPSSRFAAMRVINKLAFIFPDLISHCNADVENLISDENKLIATLAITTLLKTGGETAVEHLLARIQVFMAEIQDELKIMIIHAVEATCIRCKHKYRVLLSFLSTYLRDEGGFDYKQAIVCAIIQLFNTIPESKELALSYLSEFIEDCEYSHLSCEVLFLLGEESPDTSDPGKYLRYIYNRVILEKPSVRAAAVSAMTSIAERCQLLRQRIVVLLKRCLYDTDDEVRDRASSAITLLEKSMSTTFNTLDPLTLTVFENNLLDYSASCSTNPIDLQSIVNLTVEQQIKASHDFSPNEKLHVAPASDVPSSIGLIPELITYGEVFKSSSRKKLTEDETEYKISCVKHVYNEFIVFEFFCSNTIEDQTLADVSVEIEALTPLDGLTEVSTIPLEMMPLGSYGSTFSIFKRPVDKCVVGKFSCTLKFTCKDVDPVSGSVDDEGYRDEYALEDLDLFISDYICSSSVKDFHMSWSETTESHEESELTYTFPGSIDEATGDLKGCLGFNPCVDNVESDASRNLCFAGEFADRSHIFIKAKLSTGDYSCSSFIRLACRAPSRTLCQEVLRSFN